MNLKRNKKILILLLLVTIINLYLYISECVKPAMLPWNAKLLCDNIEYFIVGTFVNYGNGGLYYIKDKEKIPIYLTGRNPVYELAPLISGEDANNKYLVKGYIDWELSEVAKKEVLVAEEWEIIAPISRSYDIEDPNKRLFYPILYIDRHDENTGAYYKIVDNIRALEWYEVLKVLKENTKNSYIVTSEYVEGNLQWYMIHNEDSDIMDYDIKGKESFIPIEVKGCNICEHFGQEILANRYNRFLICGKYIESENTIYTDKWYIIAPIIGKSNYSNQFNYGSRYYFEQQDVNLGIYIP